MKVEVKTKATPLPLVPSDLTKKWVGYDLGAHVFDRAAWLAKISIEPASVLDTPQGHLTLLFGMTDEGSSIARQIITDAALSLDDIVFESAPRLVEPNHSDRGFWCLHVDVAASPKLVALLKLLRARVPTPGERADHEVVPHMTCLVVKRRVPAAVE
jgi:hypothetical protein